MQRRWCHFLAACPIASLSVPAVKHGFLGCSPFGGDKGARTVAHFTRDQGFESCPLQRRVSCEPEAGTVMVGARPRRHRETAERQRPPPAQALNGTDARSKRLRPEAGLRKQREGVRDRLRPERIPRSRWSAAQDGPAANHLRRGERGFARRRCSRDTATL